MSATRRRSERFLAFSGGPPKPHYDALFSRQRTGSMVSGGGIVAALIDGLCHSRAEAVHPLLKTQMMALSRGSPPLPPSSLFIRHFIRGSEASPPKLLPRSRPSAGRLSRRSRVQRMAMCAVVRLEMGGVVFSPLETPDLCWNNRWRLAEAWYGACELLTPRSYPP